MEKCSLFLHCPFCCFSNLIFLMKHFAVKKMFLHQDQNMFSLDRLNWELSNLPEVSVILLL